MVDQNTELQKTNQVIKWWLWRIQIDIFQIEHVQKCVVAVITCIEEQILQEGWCRPLGSGAEGEDWIPYWLPVADRQTENTQM